MYSSNSTRATAYSMPHSVYKQIILRMTLITITAD